MVGGRVAFIHRFLVDGHEETRCGTLCGYKTYIHVVPATMNGATYYVNTW